MTIVEDTAPQQTRNRDRAELAALLELDPATLADSTLLREQLGLDSLAMLTVLSWLEQRGVSVAGDRVAPTSVGEVLTLLRRRGAHPAVSIVVGAAGSAGLFDQPASVPAAPSPPAASPLVPVLANRVYRLAPIGHDDLGFLYSLAVHPETCFRWRFRGAPPSMDQFAADLWSSAVLVQYVVRRVADDQPVGHVVAYAADLAHGHAYLGAVFDPRHTGTGFPAQASTLFARYLFHNFPLRKLYLEIPGFNWPLLASGEGRLFEVEGVLREHDFYAGRHWDKYLCALYRDRVPDDAG